jgi:kynurenine formamidase
MNLLVFALMAVAGFSQMSRMAIGEPQTLNQFYTPVKNTRESIDLYWPTTGANKPPLLFYVPGGAWITGDKSEYAGLAKAFSQKGWAVAVINYRYSSEAIKYPAQVDDAAAALRWLAANHPELTSKIFVMGHSAGAHSAAVLALDSKYRSAIQHVKGFIGLEGIYDVPSLIKVWPKYAEWFVNLTFGKKENWAAASPQFMHASSPSRWLVVHSRGDELVDLAQSQHFVTHLREGKNSVDYFEPGAGSHFGVVETLSDPTQPTFVKVLEFINK